jgi:hypothetical protein
MLSKSGRRHFAPLCGKGVKKPAKRTSITLWLPGTGEKPTRNSNSAQNFPKILFENYSKMSGRRSFSN